MDMQRAQQQLAAIAGLDSSLEEHDIDYWIFGGWAVDFWVRSVTRDHEDIDVAAWQSDKDASRRLCSAMGGGIPRPSTRLLGPDTSYTAWRSSSRS